jgi:flagellar biogenesis protein FliO
MNPATADSGLGVFAVIGILALLLGLLWWLKARPGLGGEGAIRLVAMRPLGGKRLVALVEVESERFLLGLTDESITCLGRLAGAPAEASQPREIRELPRAAGERA